MHIGHLVTGAITFFLLAAVTSDARAADDAPFREVYDQYRAAASAGRFKDALKFDTQSTRKEIEKALKDPKVREGVEQMLRFVPKSYTVDGLEITDNGEAASMDITATYESIPSMK